MSRPNLQKYNLHVLRSYLSLSFILHVINYLIDVSWYYLIMDLWDNSSVDAFALVSCMVYFLLLVKSFLCISTSLVLFVRYIFYLENQIQFIDHDAVFKKIKFLFEICMFYDPVKGLLKCYYVKFVQVKMITCRIIHYAHTTIITVSVYLSK